MQQRVIAPDPKGSVGRSATIAPTRVGPPDAVSTPTRRLGDSLRAVADALEPQLLRIHPGDELFRCGQQCTAIQVLNSGIVHLRPAPGSGGSTAAGYRFGGDWLSLEDIASGRHTATAVAVDAGEVWVLRMDALVAATVLQRHGMAAWLPPAAGASHLAARAGHGDADAAPAVRIADLLLDWAHSLAWRGRPEHHLGLHVTRDELSRYLGVEVGAVDRALSELCAHRVLVLDRWRRGVTVDDLDALQAFALRSGTRGRWQ